MILLNLATSTLVSSLSLWRGTNANPAPVRPKKTLELYDMEGGPFCRLVREALTELDLEVKILPCPKGGKRFRETAKTLGGKYQFPFLMDPNTDIQMYESADIIAYLFKTYGKRELPLKWRATMANKITASLAGLPRFGRGLYVRPSKPPKEPLELYSFESSPFSRFVREVLCELEIPYLLHNVGKTALADFIIPNIRKQFFSKIPVEGKSRKAFVARSGKMMVPFLADPNTGIEMFESEKICKYLQKTYGT